MKAYIFFSVHEELFHRVAVRLSARGVLSHSGFVWGEQQLRTIEGQGVHYDPMIVFTRDLLPKCDDGAAPNIAWLEQRERDLGVSIQRMLAAERHLLKGRTYEQILRLAEVILREVAAALDRSKPDFIYTEDISCFTSYAHFVLARERNIPCWCIGSARLPARAMLYSLGFQHSQRVEARYRELRDHGLTETERTSAESYVTAFRERPARPPGMDTRAVKPRIELSDARKLGSAVARYFGDPADPTVTSPLQVVRQRLRRIARVRIVDATGVFDEAVAGERYVLYPIHFQPEASTLVQAPMYLDQVQLLQDVAKSLPIGYRLYVKEHVSNRGRRPLAFYQAIAAIPSVRLLSPDTNTWALIEGASAVAVITGTMGWEGVLFDKPVITFGDVWFNLLPHVYVASRTPKDDWYQLFRRALTEHQADHDALLALVVAMQQSSFAGTVGNPRTFPHVLDDDNVENIAKALALETGLASSNPR